MILTEIWISSIKCRYGHTYCDFGFYDEQSIYRLSQRELRLLVSHSPVWRQYEFDKQTNRERLIEIVKENQLLGNFPDYISGEKKFSVPVYVVWGNHEDVQVLRQLNTNFNVKNLHVLDEHHFYQFHTSEREFEFSLFGLGGNFLVSKKLFDNPIAFSFLKASQNLGCASDDTRCFHCSSLLVIAVW